MNIAMRKLAMLEKNLLEREETARVQGYSSDPYDVALRQRLTNLIDKVRII